MSGQWEKYVEPAAVAMNGGHQSHAVERWGPEVRAVLETVGPLIAEDTRDRMVVAAAAALEREDEAGWVVTAVPCEACKARAAQQVLLREIPEETDRKFVFNGDEADDVWVDKP